jgi:hypothetical protein
VGSTKYLHPVLYTEIQYRYKNKKMKIAKYRNDKKLDCRVDQVLKFVNFTKTRGVYIHIENNRFKLEYVKCNFQYF